MRENFSSAIMLWPSKAPYLHSLESCEVVPTHTVRPPQGHKGFMVRFRDAEL